ncbi:MAG TPA: Xaa-Pro peptidase family protein [Fimbriimonadaceae bacterium]|jgi:Xaa-Pro aminopeptidase
MAYNALSMVVSDAAERVQRLSHELREHGADAFFVSHPVSMQYLHGFAEDGYERFLTMGIRSSGEVVLICPALSATQAKRCGVNDIRTFNDSQDPLELFRKLAEEWKLRSGIVLVDSFMPAFMTLTMQEILPAALFKPGQHVLSKLMRKKDVKEIELLRIAAQIADQALPPALKQLKPGMTEEGFELILRAEMQRLGGKPTFCIVAAGPNSAEPHHESDDTRIQEGDVVLIDYGCSVQGYHSDTTRVVGVGHVSDEVRKVYKAVYDSQRAARDSIREGVPAEELDKAARGVIERAGYGEYFIHRTGHGIGLREHEEPFIVAGATGEVCPGDCFSIEPGIYLPGKFGVRIENIVTPTATGHESLNCEPSEEIVVVS